MKNFQIRSFSHARPGDIRQNPALVGTSRCDVPAASSGRKEANVTTRLAIPLRRLNAAPDGAARPSLP